MMRRTIATGALLLMLVLALVLSLRLRPRPATKPKETPPPAAATPTHGEPEATKAPGLDRLMSVLAGANPDEPPLSEAEARAYALEHAQRSLALYKEAMVYPPWSRPADGSTRHIIEWNEGPGLGQPFAADGEGREIRVDAALDKLYAAPGEMLTATVRVAYADDGVPAAPEEITAGVEWNRPEKGWERAAEVSLARAGDTYLARFVPSSIPALAEHPREAQLLVHVRMGTFFKRLPLRFLYAAQAPLVIHGLYGDRRQDGSLEVLLDVDVRYIAPTLVQAGLFDATGEHAIAICDDYARPTATGRQQLAIRFFGKVLRERGLDGPYRIKALHGHVRVPDTEPPELFWSHPDDPPILTHRYRAAEFSGAEWSSPEKEAKVALYLNMIDELQNQP